MLRASILLLMFVALLAPDLRPPAAEAHCAFYPGQRPDTRVPAGGSRPELLLPATTGESRAAATVDPAAAVPWWRLSRATVRDLRPADGPPRCPPELRAEVVVALKKAFAKGGPELAGAAAVALGRIGGEANTLRLAFATRSLTPSLKEKTLFALAVSGSGDEAGLELLTMVLRDRQRDDCTRGTVALGLGLSGETRAIPVLLGACRSDGLSPDLGATLAWSLGLAGDPIALPELRRLATGDARQVALAVAAMARIGTREGRAPIRGFLADVRREVVRQATLSLACAGPPPNEQETGDLTLMLRGHPDPVTRFYAAIGLGRAGAAGPIRTRLEGVEDPLRKFVLNGSVALTGDAKASGLLRREFAKGGDARLALALGILGDEESIPAVRKRLATARDWDEVEDLTTGLRLLGDDEVVKILLAKLAKGQTAYARGAAVAALARVRTLTANGPLLEILRDQKEADPLRALAAAALGAVLDAGERPLDRRIVSGLDPTTAGGCLLEVWGWL